MPVFVVTVSRVRVVRIDETADIEVEADTADAAWEEAEEIATDAENREATDWSATNSEEEVETFSVHRVEASEPEEL